MTGPTTTVHGDPLPARVSTRHAATWALISLALGSFGIGLTEFVVMGLLPNIAAELLPRQWAVGQDDAIAQTSLLISMYALGVVVGAPTIAGAVARFPRRPVLVGLAVALTLFNAATVVVPTFELVAASRFLAGLPHGAYIGIAVLVAADVLGPARRGKGVAFVVSGLTLANVVGVPLATILGQGLGWRAAFVAVGGVFALVSIAIALFVPQSQGVPGRTFVTELRVFRISQVWFTLAACAIGLGGLFSVYSFIAPLLTDVADAPEWTVPIVLVLIGLGMTAGNLFGGYLADLNLKRTLLTGLPVLATVLTTLALTANLFPALVVTSMLVGFVALILGPSLQARLMDVAGEHQSIASALNHSAFNIANMLGAYLGSIVILWGWGFVASVWVGVGLALLGFAILAIGYRMNSATTETLREPTHGA